MFFLSRTRLFSSFQKRTFKTLSISLIIIRNKNSLTQERNKDFGGTEEIVHYRSDFPLEQAQKLFDNECFAIIGYGTQGRAQSLNMRDGGFDVVLGLRQNGPSWQKALSDGWRPNYNLFSLEGACSRGTTIMNLLSDAGQMDTWPLVSRYLSTGKTLYFSHGFSIVYSDLTGVIPPDNVDVVMVAPKGAGTTLRQAFEEGRGTSSSIAIHQDYSGKAKQHVIAMGVAIGSEIMYETTFKREVYADLTGERGVLMGAIQGLFRAQYETLREKGHTPAEAFNETVEEATQSLYPLIGANGMDWMYSNCSMTAQRGALDWQHEFYNATRPVFKRLYESVESGFEARRTLEKCAQENYSKELEQELREIGEHEMWQAGRTVRQLRSKKNE